MKQVVTKFHFEKKSLLAESIGDSMDVKTFIKAIDGYYEYTKQVFELISMKDSFAQRIQGVSRGSVVANIITETSMDSLFSNYTRFNRDFMNSVEKKNVPILTDRYPELSQSSLESLCTSFLNCMPDQQNITDVSIIEEGTVINLNVSHSEYLKTLYKSQENIFMLGSVIGKPYSLRFHDRHISMYHSPTNKTYRMSLKTLPMRKEDIGKFLVENQDELVQFFGDIEYNNEGDFVGIKNLRKVSPVDLNPIHINEFTVGNRIFILNPGIVFSVFLDSSEQLYIIDHKDSGIYTYGETREDLESALKETIEILWDEIQQSDSGNIPAGQDKWFIENIQVKNVQ